MPEQKPYVSHTACAHGLDPGVMRLVRDEHGAGWIYLDGDGDMTIRVQVTIGRHMTPEQHAAELERDRQGLRRLAELANLLAAEIEQAQEAGQ